MKKGVTVLLSALLAVQVYTTAQVSCTDLNGYPQSKNIGGTGAYTLTAGVEEMAAQTYHYSGPGLITGVRIYGYAPGIASVDLVAKVYTVDANGRPLSVVASRNFNWGFWEDLAGFKDVTFFSGGHYLDANFAVSVEIDGGYPLLTNFQVGYNGDGDGNGEDLASLAGTSTGGNWVSAMTNFSHNGDFYIIPKMKNFIESDFSVSSQCISTGSGVNFTNLSNMTKDSMFNTIGLSDYGGTNEFFTWNFGDGSPVSNVSSPSHVYATPGVYTVSLTTYLDGWNNNCSDIYTKQISVGLNVSAVSVTSTSCYGSSDGSFVAVGTGGATPYKYAIDPNVYQTSATFAGLAAGTYTLYIKDNLGCIHTTTVVISQPSAVIFASNLTTNASCGGTDGSILSSATGGVGALQYSLDGTTWQASGSFPNLSVGPYTVYVKDANNCSTSASVLVNDAGGPSLTINSYTNVSCNDDNDGSILASASGGSGAYQFSIDGGDTWQASGTFNNLTSGDYVVMVKDAVGCIDMEPREIMEPNAISFTTSSVAALCHGTSTGSITVTSTAGGTGVPDYSLTGTSYQSNNTFTGLAAGTYTVYVRDAASCVETASVIVTEPTLLTISTVVTNASCYGYADGSVIVTAAGGTPDYSYGINGGMDFLVTGDFTELYAGPYTVTVTDANGCTALAAVTVNQPSPITATVTTGTSTCGNANGNILVVAAGGSGSGYQYSMNGSTWNGTGSYTGLSDSTYTILIQDGNGCSNQFYGTVADADGPVINTVSSTNITCNEADNGTITITSVTGGSGTLMYRIDASPWQLSTSFTGVSAGAHTIVVHDGLGCSGSYSLTLTEPSPIVVTTTVVDLLCNDVATGSVTISAGGGAGTMAYSLDGTTFQTSNLFSALSAGNYIAYARDAGGCIGEMSFVITEPTPIQIIGMGILNVDCYNNSTGAIGINANGGTGSLQYSLNGGTYQSSALFLNLDGGIYTVSIQDANGCTIATTATVIEPADITTATAVYDVSCFGGNDGVVNLSVSGGVAPFEYTWSNGALNEDIFFLSAGSYIVTVTDANGCTESVAASVAQPSSPIIVNGVVVNSSTGTSNDGAIDVTVTGGTGPYFYDWSNGSINPDLSGLAPGYYVVTITDDNGCATSGVFVVGNLAGVEDPSTTLNVNIYPNPATQFITLDAIDQKIDKVELLDMVGQVVVSVAPNSTKVQVDVTSLSAAFYFARTTIGNNTVTHKVQVAH